MLDVVVLFMINITRMCMLVMIFGVYQVIAFMLIRIRCI